MPGRAILRAVAWLGAAVALAFFALPLVGLLTSLEPAGLLRGLEDPLALRALALSLATTTASLALTLVFGTALAWWIAGRRGRAARALEVLVELPIVLPPAVAGVALLLTFGRRGLLGPALEGLGASLAFTSGAVIVAQTFVAAPFFVRSALAAFRSLDEELIVVARSLGAGPLAVFFRVVVPLAWPGLAGGAALAWARALGEFGATLMFAGNLPGRTQTLPLAIYAAMESNLDAAKSLSALLVSVALGLLVVARAAAGREVR